MNVFENYIELKVEKFCSFVEDLREACLDEGLYYLSDDGGISGYIMPEKDAEKRLSELWIHAQVALNHPGLSRVPRFVSKYN